MSASKPIIPMSKKLTIALTVLGFTVIFACNKKDIKSNNIKTTETYLDLPSQPYEYYGQNIGANEVATLGRVLFYDGHLSINNAVSCGSCHKQVFAFADNVAASRGFQNELTPRNSMTIQNFQFARVGSFFWDGRAQTLEELILRPIGNHVEMGVNDPSILPAKLKELGYYDQLFINAFGSDEITLDLMTTALSSFMNSVQAINTRFDKYQFEPQEFSALEQQGELLFNTKYKCNNCHQLAPDGYSGLEFMNIGLAESNDNGRGTITKLPEQDGTFKIPNLRNVARSAPYMHDGRFETLEDVIHHYSEGIEENPNLDARLRQPDGKPLRMHISEQETQALIAFLNTLTDNGMLTDEKFSNPFKNR